MKTKGKPTQIRINAIHSFVLCLHFKLLSLFVGRKRKMRQMKTKKKNNIKIKSNEVTCRAASVTKKNVVTVNIVELKDGYHYISRHSIAPSHLVRNILFG